MKQQLFMSVTLFGLLVASLTHVPFRIKTKKAYKFHYEQEIK